MKDSDKKTLIVANWKMHLNVQKASTLLHRLHENIRGYRDLEVVLAPSMLTLQPLSMEIDRRRFRLCAQDAFPKDEGPYTGEVSFAMLSDLVHYSIVGHSARRIYFHESNDHVREKTSASLRNDITPIICIGETRVERENGESKAVVHDQLLTSLMNLTSRDIEKVVIAYEPVWAISTSDGITAKPAQVSQMIKYIRKQIESLYGARSAKNIRVLYGGSVNEHDVADYLSIEGVDGVLVGAASLNYKQFTGIVETAHRLNLERR